MLKNIFKNIDARTIKVLGIVFGSVTLIIILIVVLVNMFSTTYEDYEKVEGIMAGSAKEYYKSHSDFLPSTIGNSVTLDVKTLINNELMEPLEDLLREGEKCSGKVIITKTEDNYDYVGYLNCGDLYNSIELYKVISEEKNIVTEGSGLYKIENEYVFRGEAKNNYINFNSKLWRIIKIDEQNNIALLSEFKIKGSLVWDDRYNIDYDKTIGINDFNVSRIKDSLNELYEGEDIVSNADKSKLVKRQWCIGERSSSTNIADGEVECNTLSEESSYIGLLTMYEYLNMSIDQNCAKVSDYSCTNYNYFHDSLYVTWTLTPVSKTTSNVYSISNQTVWESKAHLKRGIRTVVYLVKNAMFKSGDGTIEKPYTIR